MGRCFFGINFKENDKGNPERIIELTRVENIYSPPQHLLHYVRAYWHQDYVEDILIVYEKESTRMKMN